MKPPTPRLTVLMASASEWQEARLDQGRAWKERTVN